MWFYYALSSAFFFSIVIVLSKRIMKDVGEYVYLLLSGLFTSPFLLAFSLIFYKVPKLDTTFWLVTIFGTLISVAASILVYHAIRNYEISLINPISAFNPVFTALISFILLGERIENKAILGILLVVVGAYLLQLSKASKGLLTPLKALVQHRGVQFSFLAYFLWAITPAFEKTAVIHTFPGNPPFAAFIGQIVAIIILVPIAIKTSPKYISKGFRLWRLFLINGFLAAAAIASVFTVYKLNTLGVITAVLKLSLVFVPILGWIFFKEKNIKERFLGSVVMLIGVILLVS